MESGGEPKKIPWWVWLLVFLFPLPLFPWQLTLVFGTLLVVLAVGLGFYLKRTS